MDRSITAYRKFSKAGIDSTLDSAMREITERYYFSKTRTIDKSSHIYLERDELRQYASDVGRVWSLPWEGPERIPYKYDLSSEPLIDVETYKSPDDRFICEIPNATVFDPSGVSITEDGRVILESIGPPSLLQKGLRRELALAKSLAANRKNPSLRELLEGRVVAPEGADATIDLACPLQPQYVNYYHWTVESLLRLDLIDHYSTTTGREPVLLLPPNPPTWMVDSLEVLGYADQYRILSNPVTVNRLVVPAYPEPSRSACFWLRERARRRASPQRTVDSTRVYISRRQATKRRVANESELDDVLRTAGFDVYELENLTFDEQVELFRNVEVILGPHGAGMTNLLYSDDALVLEVFNQECRTTFYRLSQIVGHSYDYIVGSSTGPDVHVDVDELRSLLDRNDLL